MTREQLSAMLSDLRDRQAESSELEAQLIHAELGRRAAEDVASGLRAELAQVREEAAARGAAAAASRALSDAVVDVHTAKKAAAEAEATRLRYELAEARSGLALSGTPAPRHRSRLSLGAAAAASVSRPTPSMRPQRTPPNVGSGGGFASPVAMTAPPPMREGFTFSDDVAEEAAATPAPLSAAAAEAAEYLSFLETRVGELETELAEALDAAEAATSDAASLRAALSPLGAEAAAAEAARNAAAARAAAAAPSDKRER